MAEGVPFELVLERRAIVRGAANADVTDDLIRLVDERFGAGAPFRAAEDTDYLLRAQAAGIALRYEPHFVVDHHHGRRLAAEMRDVDAAISRDAGRAERTMQAYKGDWAIPAQDWAIQVEYLPDYLARLDALEADRRRQQRNDEK